MIFSVEKDISAFCAAAMIDGKIEGVSATEIYQDIENFGVCEYIEEQNGDIGFIERLPSSSDKYILVSGDRELLMLGATEILPDCNFEVVRQKNGGLFCYPTYLKNAITFPFVAEHISQTQAAAIINRINYRLYLLYNYDLSDYAGRNTLIEGLGAADVLFLKPSEGDAGQAAEKSIKLLQNICQEICLLGGAPIQMLQTSGLVSYKEIKDYLVNKAIAYEANSLQFEPREWLIKAKSSHSADVEKE